MNNHDWSKVKLLALDFDGVICRPFVIVGTDDVESVQCSHRDGQGLDLIRKPGITLPVVVITSQKSLYVEPRCAKMRMPFLRSRGDKLARLKEYTAEHCPDLKLEEVCFIGDDSSDIEVMSAVGFPVCVADGTDEAKLAARYVTKQKGGDGAIREVCDLIVAAYLGQTVLNQNVLITGTGERTTEEVKVAVSLLAYQLSLGGYAILTNGGPNGVPEAAANGVGRAISEKAIGRSIAYTYLPGATAEKCGTSEIRSFSSFEVRNGAICVDADIAVFFQGGFGTMGKLFPLMHRAMHINSLLEKKGALHLVRPKKIILHDSFAKPEDCDRIFGSTFSDKHRQILSFANSVEGIIELIRAD